MRALADRARASGAKVEGPMETLWNTVEVTVTDPDGFVLTFPSYWTRAVNFLTSWRPT